MSTRVKSSSLILLAFLIAIGLVLVPRTSPAATIAVDAQSNIFGAGHIVPPAPGGLGPGILPPVHYFAAGPSQVLAFSSVTGSISYNNGGSWWGPEGYDPWLYGMIFPSYGGISGIITSSYEFLAGVFLDDTEPADPAPSSLDFGPDGLTRNFTEVYPEIGQLFFIGDGMTDSGETQRFHVPPTATRLFLGFIDTDADYLPGLYLDNLGSLVTTFDISPEPPPPALVGFWNFDEDSEDTAFDSSAYGNNGAIIGATAAAGECGGALYFDPGLGGGIDYVVVPNSDSINTSTFTVSFWVSISDLDESMVFVHKRNGQWWRNFEVSYNTVWPNGEPKHYLRVKIDNGTSSNDYDNAAYAEVSLESGRYYYVVGTYDQEKLKLYLDGIKIAEHSITMTDNVGGGDLYIGTHSADYLTMNPTHGIIDEVRIYNYALTHEQIQTDMITCSNAFCVRTAGELQSALTIAASNGEDDVLHLVQGTYNGNFVYDSTQANSLTIEGGYTEGCADRLVDPAANTVLDGQDSGRVLELTAPTVAADFVVDGLTLQHGNTWRGGGLYEVTSGGNVNITDCMIFDNYANGDGGGVFVSGAETITLNRNTISYNDAASGGGLYIDESKIININYNTISYNESRSGGALDIRQPETIDLIGNTISYNSGRSWGGALIYSDFTADVTVAENTISYNNNAVGDGCGIYIQAETAIVENNIISNNQLAGGGAGGIYLNASVGSLIGNVIRDNSGQDGGGVRYRGGSILLANNIITNNYASLSGGGVIGGNLATKTILTNNTIVNNHSHGSGGGLYLRLTDSVSSDVYNNIIYNNSSPSGADIYLWNDIGAVINLYNNDFDQTQPSGIYIQNPSTVNYGDNLNNVDPLFVDPTNDDYHLTLGSPCRDGGTEPDFGLPATDFEGDSRICGLAPDIGADEVACFDSDGDGIPDDEDACPTSDLSDTVVIDGCDSGVDNECFDDGCTISDRIAEYASDSTKHDEFVSSIAHYTNDLKKDGVITGAQKGAIQSCTGQAGIL